MTPDMKLLRTAYQVRHCITKARDLCAGMVSRLNEDHHMAGRAAVGHKSFHKTLPTGGRMPRRHKWTQLEDTCLRAAVQVST